MMTRRLALLTVTLVATVWCPAAFARWTTYGVPGAGPLTSDGDRYAVMSYGPGSAEVFDDLAPAAGFRHVTYPAECRFADAVGSGKLALSCPASSGYGFESRLLDLQSGALAVVPLPFNTYSDGDFAIEGIGTHWIHEVYAGYHVAGRDIYSNIATGGYTDVDALGVVPDLDADDAAQPACAPTRRFPYVDPPEDLENRVAEPATLSGAWLVSRRKAGKRVDLVRWKCGAAAPRRIARCSKVGRCKDAQTGAGYVSWLSATRVATASVATGRVRTLTRPTRARAAKVVHTRHFVFVTWGTRAGYQQVPDSKLAVAARP